MRDRPLGRGNEEAGLPFGGIALGLLALAAPADDRFDVPPGTLSDALIDFSRQADLHLLVSSGLTRGIESSGVQGAYPAEQALDRLLQGTGLDGRITEAGVVIIVASEAAAGTGRNEMRTSKKGLALGSSVLSVLAGVATAQESAADEEVIDEIIVVGTAGAAGTNRQDASFAVTTIDAEAIERFKPSSTAELFTQIPGVWVESSGGVAGANIFVRGLPSGGDAPFVTLAIGGGPIYGTETLSFFEQSSIFRADQTIERVEGLRGGPNAVFGKGEPGLTVNFNLKEGGEETEGRVEYTYSDFEANRLDAVVSGPLGDGLTYMVGGYWRQSEGLRDTDFISEEGYQITAHLVKEYERGKLSGYVRRTDDFGQWVLPQALGTGNDPGTFAQLGDETRFRTIQTGPNGETQRFDFADGRGWDGVIAGGRFEHDLTDAATFRSVLTYTSGNADTLGFVPAGAAVAADAVAGVIGEPVRTSGGETLGQGDFVQTYGHWVVFKDIDSLTSDTSVNLALAGHDITVGAYLAGYGAEDTWYLGNPVGVQNVANGPLLANVTPGDIAAAGGAAGFSFGLRSDGDAENRALYVADSWQVTEDFRIDGGIRHEWFEADYRLDTGPGYADGTIDLDTSVEGAEWAYTIAGDYTVAPGFSGFLRYSKGFLFPHFDEIREGALNVDDVRQTELGLKYTGDMLSLYGTAFYNTNDSFASNVGSAVANASFETEAIGVELDGTFRSGAFATRVNATVQEAEIIASSTAGQVGNSVQRQPDWQIRVQPSYTLTADAFEATVYGAFSAIGERFGDLDNTVVLDGYQKLDLGVLVEHESGVFAQIFADNLNDSDGITEGDPRDPSAPNGRPIFGRSVNFSVGIDF